MDLDHAALMLLSVSIDNIMSLDVSVMISDLSSSLSQGRKGWGIHQRTP